MPCRLSGVLIFLLVSVLMSRAQGDIVLMQIGDESVSKGEFEYYWHRSPIDNLQEYLPIFIDYKRKVLYAKELGLDTLPDFSNQRTYYVKVLDTNDSLRNDPNSQRQQTETEWLKLGYVTQNLMQRASRSEEQKAKTYLDSLYVALKVKEGTNRAIGKSLWIPKRFLIEEWTSVLERLDKNEISCPFSSPLGMHIVWWEAKEQRIGFNSSEKTTVTDEDRLLKIQEIEDALLVATLQLNNGVSFTENDLEFFFDKHRSEYAWELPHYKGAVFHCRNKKKAKEIKKLLKRRDFCDWKGILHEMKVDCKVEHGLFQIGMNQYVDKLVFKCGGFEPLEDYPYVFVMGKKMKVPASYLDIREKVLEDYLQWKDKSRKHVLEQKYKVEIKEEVLKTVNNSRNN